METLEYDPTQVDPTESESGADLDHESDRVFSEVDELELGAELVGVQNEADLDRFLSRLLGRAVRVLRKGLRPVLARILGGLLKGAIRRVLPRAVRADGGARGAGRSMHSRSLLAVGTSQLLGLELEGLSHEDQEFEAAKQIVRLAGAAVANATKDTPARSPAEAAQRAVVAAARDYSPGLLREARHTPDSGGCRCHAHSGRWERSGNEIILDGL